MAMKQKELTMAKNKKKQTSEPVDSELQNIVEAALYSADEPLGIRKFISTF